MSVIKAMAGMLTARLDPRCRFDRCIFVIGHMRCGSTALSNILCSRPEISGYGETHIRYADQPALGVLALNHRRRIGGRPGSRYLFDKILHSRYLEHVPEAFFDARAIFVAREPVPSVRSIRNLFARISADEYASDREAAAHYRGRLAQMLRMWDQFPGTNRVALRHADLTTQPDRELARISSALAFEPPLANVYASNPAALRRGAGDPLSSGKLDRIVAAGTASTLATHHDPLDLSVNELEDLQHLYDRYLDLCTAQ